MDLKGKTIIVTGGASGLGGACVKLFVQAGANVVIADLNEEHGNGVASELGGKALFVKTNVADGASAENCVNSAWNKFGGLNGLINCAGVGTPERVVSKEGQPAPLEGFSKVIGINLVGSYNMIRLAAASMISKNPNHGTGDRGVIINTASVAAFDGQIGQTAYSASKGGIVAMALPLAREFSRHAIRVMTIAPGIFETPMLAGLDEKVRASLGAQVPYPSRLGRPDEYATLAKHIFENEMLNGEVIRLDGAIRMAPK